MLLLVLGIGVGAAMVQSRPWAQKERPYYAFTLLDKALYFGHLKKEDGHYLYLTDARVLKQSTFTDVDPEGKEIVRPQYQLTKPGDAFYGQKSDLLKLNRDQVVSIQELGDDSPLVQAYAQENALLVPDAPGRKTP